MNVGLITSFCRVYYRVYSSLTEPVPEGDIPFGFSGSYRAHAEALST